MRWTASVVCLRPGGCSSNSYPRPNTAPKSRVNQSQWVFTRLQPTVCVPFSKLKACFPNQTFGCGLSLWPEACVVSCSGTYLVPSVLVPPQKGRPNAYARTQASQSSHLNALAMEGGSSFEQTVKSHKLVSSHIQPPPPATHPQHPAQFFQISQRPLLIESLTSASLNSETQQVPELAQESRQLLSQVAQELAT